MNEFDIIERFAAALPRPAAQRNALHESDAELLELPGGITLAATTDELVEEIGLGLYRDPETIGWMAITASASDLAAVGADPLAALVTIGAPPDMDPSFLAGLADGVAAAARATGLGIAGGDTNETPEFRIGCTALGTLPTGTGLTRRGCRPGDLVFATGPLGSGSHLAYMRFSDGDMPRFRPKARLAAGHSLRGISTACVDTSDGALDAVWRLASVNGVGFDLFADRGTVASTVAGASTVARAMTGSAEAPAPSCFDPIALATVRAAGLPDWLLLAGLHGEFELVFTTRPGREADVHAAGARAGWEPILLGAVTEEPAIRFQSGDGQVRLDPVAIRRAFAGFGRSAGGAPGDFSSLIRRLLALQTS